MKDPLQELREQKYKTKLTKQSGFWQIEITELGQELSAVIAFDGHVFWWNGMPLGLTIAPATFEIGEPQFCLQCCRQGAEVRVFITCTQEPVK